MKRILQIFQLFIIVLFYQNVQGQDAGDLDPTFGDGGKLLINCANSAKINDMEILNNGQIVVAGSCTDENGVKGVLVLLNDDGSIDTSFGEDGFVYISLEGFANTEIEDIEVFYPDGKISPSEGGGFIEVAARGISEDLAYTVIELSLVDDNGAIDLSFGDQGFSEPFEANSFAGMVLTDGADYNTVVATTFFPTDMPTEVELRKFDSGGIQDVGWSGFEDGIVKISDTSGEDKSYTGTSMNIDQIGRFIVTGDLWSPAAQEPFAAAITPEGALDQSFGVGGIFTGDLGASTYTRGAFITDDNKVAMGGYSWNEGLEMHDKLIIKLTSAGMPDLQFGTNGYNFDSGQDAYGETFERSIDEMIMAGEIYDYKKSSRDWQTTIFLTRYLADGSVDETFGDNGDVSTGFGGIYNFADVLKVYADKILVGGNATVDGTQGMALVRYLNDVNVSVDNHKENVVAVKIYPVPADEFVTVELNGDIKDKYSVSIMNTLGQVVYRADDIIGPNEKKLILSTAGLDRGLDLVRVEDGSNVFTKKLLITN
jgi:uncharacterized delta-60 repeat protein